MLSLIQGQVVTQYHWMTMQEFTDVVAISQMTPGPIGINTATYCGYTAVHNAGMSGIMAILGSAMATFALVIMPDRKLAEFTLEGDLYIIDPGKLEWGQRQPYEPRRGRPVAFLDIAAGGDETVLAICDGNEAWIEYAERQRDTVQSVRKCIATLKGLGIADCDLWEDAPGMGLAVISDFNESGWYPNEFFGNNPPEDRDRYITTGDMLNRNVTSALNSNVQFLRGLAEGGAIEMSEDDILADVSGDLDATREDTASWLFGFLLLAYHPLDDTELEAYIAFSQSDAGQALNRALFNGFGAAYDDISYALGRAVALNMTTQEL